MAWRCSGSSNKELVDNLFRGGLITSSRVRDAMMKVCASCSLPHRHPLFNHTFLSASCDC
jgi:hypothetical protein